MGPEPGLGDSAVSLILLAQLLFLLLVANGAPILLKRVLGDCGNWPIDLGWKLPVDDRPLLGSSKTWRGLLVAVLCAGMTAPIMNMPIRIGLLIGLWAMLGDLLSSFMKRRAGLSPGAMALGLDQIPESLMPLLAVRTEVGISLATTGVLVLLFLVTELVLSRLLFAWHIRERPY